MIIEGRLEKQENGRYSIIDEERSCELTCGDCIGVKHEKQWIEMRVEHDGNGYYLIGEWFSFYPKQVYARYNSNFSRF